MSAVIQLRREPLSVAEQQALWRRLSSDIALADIPYKIETDAWGGVLMSPSQTKHSRMARRVSRMLEERLGGEALTELAIMTPGGVKVPDVAWCSEGFLRAHWLDSVLLNAPEICIEVVSPSNSEREMLMKAQNYFDAGTLEVWMVFDNGVVHVHTRNGTRDDSRFGFNPTIALSA